MKSARFRLRCSCSIGAVAGVLAIGCGVAVPSATPLSAPSSRSMARVKPSSTRAPEGASEERTEIESEPSPVDDDDDDSSTKKASPAPHQQPDSGPASSEMVPE